MQVLPVLPPKGAAKRSRLDLQIPRQAHRRGERFLHLEALKIGNGEEDVTAKVRIHDGAQRELDLLHGKADGLLALVSAQERVVAVQEEQRTALISAFGVEDRADVGIEGLRATQELRRGRCSSGRGWRRLRRRSPLLRRGGGVLAQGLLQLPPQRLGVLTAVRGARLRDRDSGISWLDSGVGSPCLRRGGHQRHQQDDHPGPLRLRLRDEPRSLIHSELRFASRARPGSRKTDATTTMLAPVGSCSIQLT